MLRVSISMHAHPLALSQDPSECVVLPAAQTLRGGSGMKLLMRENGIRRRNRARVLSLKLPSLASSTTRSNASLSTTAENPVASTERIVAGTSALATLVSLYSPLHATSGASTMYFCGITTRVPGVHEAIRTGQSKIATKAGNAIFHGGLKRRAFRVARLRNRTPEARFDPNGHHNLLI